MELLFLWIENFKNIKEQGFNFSPKYQFTFTPEKKEDGEIIDGELTKEDFNFPDNFFDINGTKNCIQNITAVIGANGCGKSSLLEAISNFSLGSGIETFLPNAEIYRADGSFKGVWVIKNEKKCFFVFQNIVKTKVKTNFEKFIEWNYSIDIFPFIGKEKSKERNYQRCNFVKEGLNILPVYYTNIFREEIIITEKENRNDYTYIDEGTPTHIPIKHYNISINYLFRNQTNDIISIKMHYWQEMQRIIFFIQEFWHWFEKGNNLNFRLPKYLHLKSAFNRPSIDDELRERYGIGKLIVHNLKEEDYIFLYPKTKIILFFWQQWIGYFYNSLEKQEIIIKKILKEVCQIKYKENDFHNNSLAIEKAFTDFAKRIREETSAIENFSSIPNSHDFIAKVQKFIHSSFVNRLLTEDNSYDIIVNRHEIDSIITELKNIEFVSPYTFAFSFKEKLTQATMSSGEKNFLVLFSRLYWIKKEIYKNETTNSILLLLDEAELTLHPDWQRQFLEYIIYGVNKIFEGYQIQIILTSHSPYVVSDLPKGNVIFLEDKDGMCKVVQSDIKNTFGANIHTLLRNSFFLKKGLMGSFAMKKINKLISALNNNESRTEEMQQQINMIGEPILHERLQQLYQTNNDEAMIVWHENEAKRLRDRISVERDIKNYNL
jgi:predicted ATP-binding protein involved in virulence